jgi:hypothetical protein
MSESAAFELESANDIGSGTIPVRAFIWAIEDTTTITIATTTTAKTKCLRISASVPKPGDQPHARFRHSSAQGSFVITKWRE